jgi:hypothetical protein
MDLRDVGEYGTADMRSTVEITTERTEIFRASLERQPPRPVKGAPCIIVSD